MSTYDFSQLVKLWSLESITSEQAIGQLLLHLQSVHDRIAVLEKLIPHREDLNSEDDETTSLIGNEIRDEEATEEVNQPIDPSADAAGSIPRLDD